MTDSLSAGAQLVLDLLNYIEQLEKLKTKPAFSVPNEFFVAFQHDLKGLPELKFNLQIDGDDVWLRIPRMQEIAAPDLDEKLKPWVTLPKSPEKIPEIKDEAVICDGMREIGRGSATATVVANQAAAANRSTDARNATSTRDAG